MADENKTLKSPAAEREEKILEFWSANNVFQKSVDRVAPKGDFVFYDGPPFATGLPHFGHVLPTSIKDAVPRYKTMQGFRVRRRWGWDCHGLPIENMIEKELGLATKKDILDYGIGKFNQKAKESVLRYADEWRTIIPRLGRWVDMENDYRTMDASYTESVWWAFKELHDKGLIYEGFKSMQLCPRCETTLSNFEVNQGYKDITDISVFVKFELSEKIEGAPTYFLAWTTTPWTLPGNVALAINPDITYVTIEIADEEKNLTYKLILAEDRLSIIKKEYTVISKTKGADLVGKSYKPLFDYYSKTPSAGNQNAWKVYAADFVTTTDGTGIVHIAPAFGSDDMELAKKQNLPFIQHVGTDGRFKREVTDFAGTLVKPKSSDSEKDAHQKADIEVIKYLAAIHGDQKTPALFAKEKIIHSYPHCWRCDTPLLNYASSSWFVKVPDFKDKLVAENKKVHWVPDEVGEGRFGNWLSGARDWAISRSRFWGAPLPVWRTEPDESGKTESVVVGSLADLKKYSRANNTYFVMRHGEAENNTKSIISSTPTTPHHLTEKGIAQVKEAALWLLDKKIDIIYASPFVRTRETAEVVAEGISFPKEKIIHDEAIGELKAGTYDGVPFSKFIEDFPFEGRFDTRPPDGKIKGENYVDIKKRMGDFIYSLEKKYSGKDAGKRILIVTHDSPLFLLISATKGLDQKETIELRGMSEHFSQNAKPIALDFVPIPHSESYELDFHRPFIDEIELIAASGKRMTRIPEVFDCWFESGSMPFGEAHYPFNSREFSPNKGALGKVIGLFKKSKGYPADFIAEGLDQTRGWFYSMLVLGVALFGKSPYKNVIVNGLVLAEDGQKMSKSKKNFPDLMPVVEKYGADALRYYLLSSPLVRAQEFCFSERGVDEVVKKHIGRLNNVVTFYELYADKKTKGTKDTVDGADLVVPETKNILDLWIMARISELTKEVTKAMDAYELDKATRPFADFIDDLSTWYLRRSRDRFKSDNLAEKKAALDTMRFVLVKTATLLAPFMPFIAEDMYQKVVGGESVHLQQWPLVEKTNDVIIKKMAETRRITSLALEARMKAKINVRQPLATLYLKTDALESVFADLIKDELNVKEIKANTSVINEVELDTIISSELKEEGNVREFMRAIQDIRKEKNFTVSDLVKLSVSTNAEGIEFLKKNSGVISKTTGLIDISFSEGITGNEVLIDSFRFVVSIVK
jgi:isoleucyl-tRNA synthetase